MRKKIYETVHIYNGNYMSVLYKWFMIAITLLSFIPLMYKETNPFFYRINIMCLAVYSIDYILRFITADYRLDKFHWTAFARYPIRLISIVDIMSIISLLCYFFNWQTELVFVRLLLSFRVIRVLRYSQSVRTVSEILYKTRKSLFAVGGMAVGYIALSALIMFNAEPESFNTFFEAVYWATVSLTTVGYGDICPVTILGRCVAMLSSFFGIAIVALPAGIVTAEFINVLKENETKNS